MINHTPILEAACRFFREYLTTDHRAFLSKKYGYSQVTIDDHRLGYAPVNAMELPIWLLEQGFKNTEIRTSGLVWISDDGNCGSVMRGRRIFPYIVNGNPAYFIGRETDETPHCAGVPTPPKYKKMKAQKDPEGKVITPQEPIFGIDTVREGQPLIITEGVADCISAHQAGFAAISPGTIRFKGSQVNEVQQLCKIATKTYIVMDNEVNEAGLDGAIDTGLKLCRLGVLPYIATIPRTETQQKIDLNDYIREGGDVRVLFADAVYIEDHPAAVELIRNEWKSGAARLSVRAVQTHQQGPVPQGNTDYYNVNELKSALPSLEEIIGFKGRGPHPEYGSSSGQNLDVSDDVWCCYHQGHEGGGDVLKWIACYDLNIIHESEDLRGEAFMKTCQYAAGKYLTTPSKSIIQS